MWSTFFIESLNHTFIVGVTTRILTFDVYTRSDKGIRQLAVFFVEGMVFVGGVTLTAI